VRLLGIVHTKCMLPCSQVTYSHFITRRTRLWTSWNDFDGEH